MNTEKTASEIRYQKSAQELAQKRFWKHPECAAEVIAKHYVSHALLALEACKLIALKDEMNSDLADLMIKECIDQILTNHLHDFGTELIPQHIKNPTKVEFAGPMKT